MKKIGVILISFLFLMGGSVAFSDAGPKPSLVIEIEGVTGETCLVDLLIESKTRGAMTPWETYDGVHQAHYELIKAFDEEGWIAAQANGLMPISGYPEVAIESGSARAVFTYRVPDVFKILLVQDDGTVVVSDVVEKRAFDSVVVFDVQTGKAQEKSVIGLTLWMLLRMFVITLVLEGAVFWAFGFRTKADGIVFLKVNAFTQVLLALAISWSTYTLGMLLALFAFALGEVFVFVVEPILFARYLSDHSRGRRVAFALVANAVSAVLGTYLFLKVGA